MKRIIVLACVLALTGVAAHAQTCQHIGPYTYCSNGLESNTVGNFTYYNNGQTRQSIGPYDFYTPAPSGYATPLPQVYTPVMPQPYAQPWNSRR